MLKDNVTLTGDLTIKVFDEHGALKQEVDLHNLVVTTGKNHIAARLVGTPTAMGWMAIGTGSVAPVVGDTALGAELARVAVSAASSTGNVATFSATFPAGTGTGAITEAGIFNASSSGTMLSRVTFSVVNKGASDTMSITWTISVN